MRTDDSGNVWIRQSWLGDYFLDPERARLKIKYPEDDIGGDAAHCGTGAHSGIQLTIEQLRDGGSMPTRRQIAQVIRDSVDEKIETEGIKWQKFSSLAELLGHSQRCYEAWAREILPVLQYRSLITSGALCEHSFQVVLYQLPDGSNVGLEGTIDFAPEAHELWDWKTAGREYRPKEKQEFAVQPTAYCAAAVLGGIPNGIDYEWPLDFTYGIAVRRVGQAKAQLLTVRRTEAHFDFMLDRIRACVEHALEFGFDRPWAINDGAGNWLCSDTWCPWWKRCKGAHGIDDSLPVQLPLAA